MVDDVMDEIDLETPIQDPYRFVYEYSYTQDTVLATLGGIQHGGTSCQVHVLTREHIWTSRSKLASSKGKRPTTSGKSRGYDDIQSIRELILSKRVQDKIYSFVNGDNIMGDLEELRVGKHIDTTFFIKSFSWYAYVCENVQVLLLYIFFLICLCL
ncbi:hypothetical protein GIB67_024103 [Kingdonia uniflora]|uniref:Uncharacterized protein n=1 Tax=Kingdonia uniflora TaxID=39325 RepID=A0A7J7MMM4_9MAGN|nr:hypothetical protein GIB67_024103 [Kingdonia uniflora]